MEFDLNIILGLLIVLMLLVFHVLKSSSRAVRRGDERFQKIFRVTPVAVVITTLNEGRVLDANNAYWQLTGLKPGQTIGRTTTELGLWKSTSQRRDFIQRLVQQGSFQNPNYEFTNQVGERQSTIAYYELTDLDSEPVVLTMLYDVTKQRKIETALQKSDERFHRVFQSSPVAIVITTLQEGRIIDANAAYWKLSGYDPDTSIGRTTFELQHGLQPEKREQFIQELLEHRSIQNPTYDFVNTGGEHLNTIAFFELIEINGQLAILSMFYDMTDQSRARQALHLSEARWRAMLEAVPDTVLEMKRDGTIVQFIPSANNELGYMREAVIGRNVSEVMPDMAEPAAFAIQRVLESGQLHAFEFTAHVNEDLRTFEARITPAGGDQVLAMLRDVSLNKWSEAERESLITELEQKNAELERFTYTVSHDLKSPLITIRGFLGFVREDAKAGNLTRLDKDVQRIVDATERMQSLLADLLELSRVGRVKNRPESIDTGKLLGEVIELLHGRIEAEKLEVKVTDELPSIFGDRARLFEVFQNLIDNAAKFMGGQTFPQVEIGARGELNEMPIFYVKDNGIGIAPEYHEQVFGLFNKLDARMEGTGVGLALVKRIVEFHGGQIWLESEPGLGATFFFTLPNKEF